jgi:ABC-type sugar transport system permease subunit
MIAPFFVLAVVFELYVLLSGIRLSLTNASGVEWGSFVGLSNFEQLLWANPYLSAGLWRAVGTTFAFTAASVVTQLPIALGLSVLLDRVPFPKVKAFFRAAFLIPLLINSVATAMVFTITLRREGALNQILGLLGLPSSTDWLRDSSYTLFLLVLVSFWRSVGFQAVIFLGQLQTIDPALYEAARLEGASPWTVFRRITLPLLRPGVTFSVVTITIGALQMFDIPFLLFPFLPFGPGGKGMTLVGYVYNLAFQGGFETGLASAAGWLIFVVVLAVSLIQLRVLGLGKQDEV